MNALSNTSTGKYIVIEGIEGVGKSTIIERLARELQAAQIPVQIVAASGQPEDTTAQAIRRIIEDPRYPLNNRTDVLLYNAVRCQSLDTIQKTVASGVTCLIDQSYLSTLVNEYYGRGDITDYVTAGQIIQFATGNIQPDLLMVLDAPVDVIKKRLSAERLAMLDEAYLERVRAGYLWEAKQRNLPTVYTTDTIDVAFDAVWQRVRQVVDASSTPQGSPNAQSVAEVLAANPPAKASPAEPSATETMPEQTVATTAVPSDTQEQRLNGQQVTLESASQLLAAKIAATHAAVHAPTLDSPTPLDQKDSNGHYQFYIPAELKGKLRSQYIRTMNQLFDTHAKLVADLTTHIRAASTAQSKQRDTAWRKATEAQARRAVRPLLPVAVTAQLTMDASHQPFERLVAPLLHDALPEAQAAGRQLAGNKRVTSHAAERNATRGVSALAQELLPANYTAESEPLTLTQYTPHNELDIAIDILYAQSDLPLRILQQEILTWPYQRKVDLLTACSVQRADCRALEKMHYSFDVVCDYSTFLELLCGSTTEALAWQTLSPRLGYDVPLLTEETGLSDAVEQCFDVSMQLHSSLQSGGFLQEAQYAILLGHKVRWQATFNARELLRLSDERLSANGRKLVQQLSEKIAEVHPLLAETAHLTRTAANPEQANVASGPRDQQEATPA